MNYIAIHMLIVTAVLVAPLLTVRVVRLVPIGHLTHHQNTEGTYDRNLWLRALSPILAVGWEEEALLYRIGVL